MTDKELDRIMKRVLLDSLKLEDEKEVDDQEHSFTPTIRHKRQMRTMLENPIRWVRQQKHPWWIQAAKRIAVILLTCIVVFGGVMTFDPTARASLIRWVVDWYDNNIGYVYSGDQNEDMLPQFEITDLPDGYVEKSRDMTPGLVAITYENQTGDVLYLVYNFMHQGAQTDITLNEDRVFEVMVNQMKGYFFESTTSEGLNTVMWIDEVQSIHFSLDGSFDMEELLHIAESVSLCETTK